MTPATQYLYQLLTGNALSQPVSVAATLGLPDLLANGPRTVEELAAATATHAPSLDRLLRALAALGIVIERGPGKYEIGEAGKLLRRGVPGSLHALAVLAGEPWRAASFDLLASVRTGEAAFERRFGAPMYRYFEAHPEAARAFNEVQALHAAALPLAAFPGAPNEGAAVIVDVGGGTGAILRRLLEARPEARGVLFDLPSVIAQARGSWEAGAEGDPVGARCRLVEGDFFAAVPKGGDLYLLCFVLHNWDDERAARILGRCAAVMRPGARLAVVENVLPERNVPAQAALLDLEMLVFTAGGRERTEAELVALLDAAGLRRGATRATGTGVSVIEGIREGS